MQGASGSLRKPVIPLELIDLVQRLIGKADTQRSCG
jgi:hypothetical protein